MRLIAKPSALLLGGLLLLVQAPQSAGGIPDAVRRAIRFYENCDDLKAAVSGERLEMGDRALHPGRFGKAFLFDRPSLNLIADPTLEQFRPEEWLRVGRPQHLKQGGVFGPTCVRVGRADSLRQVIAADLAKNRLYAFSVYMKAISEGTVGRISMQIGTEEKAAALRLATDRYQRLAVSLRSREDIGRVEIRTQRGAALVDGAQLEQGASHPTSFIPRSAKGDFRRKRSRIRITDKSRIDLRQGAVAVWFKPRWTGECDDYYNLFMCRAKRRADQPKTRKRSYPGFPI